MEHCRTAAPLPTSKEHKGVPHFMHGRLAVGNQQKAALRRTRTAGVLNAGAATCNQQQRARQMVKHLRSHAVLAPPNSAGSSGLLAVALVRC